jgi:hypothetical protein
MTPSTSRRACPLRPQAASSWHGVRTAPARMTRCEA